MLMIWLILRILGVADDRAFVASVVVAESYLVGRNLPHAARNIGDLKGGKVHMLAWPVGVILALAGVQLLINDPLFTQRIITGFCVFFLIIMLLGMLREQDVMDRLPHPNPTQEETLPKVSLLRVNALMAAVVIGVNEMLIASGSLSSWITGIPFLVLFLHAAYWSLVILMLRNSTK